VRGIGILGSPRLGRTKIHQEFIVACLTSISFNKHDIGDGATDDEWKRQWKRQWKRLSTAGDAVLYKPILIAFPGAYALAKGLQALLSTLLGDLPLPSEDIIWGFVAALIFSVLLYAWDQNESGASGWQTLVLNTLILWLTVTGFVSVDTIQQAVS
jgi:hypothetical protein